MTAALAAASRRTVPDIAVAFVMREEGCKLTAYQDAVGVWSVGCGHTPAHAGQAISLGTAKALLKCDLAVAVERLAACLSAATIMRLTDNEYAALLSFVYNAGAEAAWGVWAAVQHGPAAVAGQLIRFVHGGAPPRTIDGLVNRRHAEIALYEGSDPLCKTDRA